MLAAARVTIAETSVTVDLSNDWRSGGELVVVLRNVQTDIPRSLSSTTGGLPDLPYHNYPIVVSSKKSGRLDRLDPVLINHDGDDETVDRRPPDYPPTECTQSNHAVRVGNILGEKGSKDDDTTYRQYIQYYGADTVDRTFTVEPADVYQGESNKTLTITFEAKGPMYDSSIVIPIPPELQPEEDDLIAASETLEEYLKDHITVTASGRVQPSGKLDADTEFTVDTTGSPTDPVPITIFFTRIDNGAKVVLSYEFEGAPDYPTSMIVDDKKTAADDPATPLPVNESITTEVSTFALNTKLPLITTSVGGADALAATSVTGGNIRPRAGSGTLTFKDDQVEAGEDVSRLTLIYEAATALEDVTLEIEVSGIQLTDDDVDVKPDITWLQGSTDGEYGFVSFSGTDSFPRLGDLEPAEGVTTISWSGLMFTEAGQKFTTTIEDVRIQEDGGNVTFTAMIGDSPLAKSPILYITDTADAAVEFTINDGTFQSYSAAEEVDLISFGFTAKTTSIKGGQVRFTLPRNWSKPVKPEADNTVKKALQLTVTGGGTTDVNRVGNVSISGQTVTVQVPELAKLGAITITINQFHRRRYGN